MVDDAVLPQSHKFVLLSDMLPAEASAWPRWAPFSLWSRAGEDWGGPEDQHAARVLLHANCEHLWERIAATYERAESVASQLPEVCGSAQRMWKLLPKDAPSKVKRNQEAVARKANQLALELERLAARWNHERGDPPLDFFSLLSEAEQGAAAQRVAATYGDDARFGTWELLLGNDRGVPGIVPTMPELLRRLGRVFQEDAKAVHLERPSARNAERNHFTRYLIDYFKKSHKEGPSPSIVAGIVSVFFDDGISVSEVQSQLNALPSGRRLHLVKDAD